MIEHYWQTVPGWFHAEDLYCRMVEEAKDGGLFVEVGSWKGRSASFMGVEIANSGKQIDFWCVDTWAGSPEFEHQQHRRFDPRRELLALSIGVSIACGLT